MVGAPAKPSATPAQPMNKPRPNPPQREFGGSNGRRPGRPAAFVRFIVSLLIIWHFAAVFLAALSVPPSSSLVVDITQRPPMQWYLDALYLNHGHYLFAPNPGPGHLIRYELLDERGGMIAQGEFPSTEKQWPRLRYHRHLMLADQAGLPVENREVRQYWERVYLESYARHLLRINQDAQMVRLRRIEHWPLPLPLAIEGRKITDPEGYQTLLEVSQRRSDLGPEAGDQSSMWQGGRQDMAGRWIGGPR